MLGFCDEVVVVDGGSTDGTYYNLLKMQNLDSRIKIYQNKKDWNDERFAVFDGDQKAVARSHCTSEWCWQQDSDEIVHEDDYQKVQNIIKMSPKSYDLVALPVVEYWGNKGKVRVDINPWKWRLSKNKDYITHGIPKHLRKYDDNNRLYASLGTDGCDYIDKNSGEIIPFVNFYTNEVHNVKQHAMQGNSTALESYENWYNNIVNYFPTVFHYSWYDLERKIKTYKNYWSKHWQSLYDIKQEDTSENNMFFNKPWNDVSEDEIKSLSLKLESNLGGWIFHRKVDFEQKTPWVFIEKEEPQIMKEKK
jgi:glycosyltransferase involved in cell wall biosynthesis